MAQPGYQSVSLPQELIVEIDRIVEQRQWGFRSRPEFLTAAARELLLRMRAADVEARNDPPTQSRGLKGRRAQDDDLILKRRVGVDD